MVTYFMSITDDTDRGWAAPSDGSGKIFTYVGYHTHKNALPVIPLTVLVTLPIPVMSDACAGIVRPFILHPF
jgi:hypothetical protein